MPVSERLKRAAALEGKTFPVQEYEITDPHHVPDLKGEFAGARVVFRGGKQYVMLTDAQAKFYKDQGVITQSSESSS